MTVAQPTSIEPVTRENWRSTLPLEVAPDQQRFVAHYSPISLVILAKAHVGALGKHWVPLLIRRDGEPAGMVAVAYDESDPAADCWVFHFFIDHRHQGTGTGSAALLSLLHHLRQTRPACRRVVLTVHPENLPAQRLYRKHGFSPTGDFVDGEPVYALTPRTEIRVDVR